MITVDTTHKLFKDEIDTLRHLVGKSLTDINCSGVDMNLGFAYYDFIDTLNLSFQEITGFITISAMFDETNFGDDFIKINIKQENDPIGIKRHEQGGLQHPFVNLHIYPEFVIRKIEIYGASYVCQSANNENERFWKIEIDNPGQAIVENVETENIIVLHSDDGRLLIDPYGAVPWIRVTSDNKLIDNSIMGKGTESNANIKLKHEIK